MHGKSRFVECSNGGCKAFDIKVNIPKGNFWIMRISILGGLHQFSRFNNFLWGCWCLCKNLSNFVHPAWKLDNPYHHNLHILSWSTLNDFVRFSSTFIWYLTHFHCEPYFLFWVRTYVFRKVLEEKLWFSIKTINNPYFRFWSSLFLNCINGLDVFWKSNLYILYI